jgi:hypothetical protein
MRSALRTGPSRRTAAERAAINARAAAYPRPLSATQVKALKTLAAGYFIYTRAGWCRHNAGKCTEYFSTQTVDALCRRGFAFYYQPGEIKRVLVSAVGRREAARHR